jgi:hypothetical protein
MPPEGKAKITSLSGKRRTEERKAADSDVRSIRGKYTDNSSDVRIPRV